MIRIATIQTDDFIARAVLTERGAAYVGQNLWLMPRAFIVLGGTAEREAERAERRAAQ
jgi:hypothetical protein